METFDVVVIGGGPGGYPAAIRAAQLGARVALVERESLGGTCLNWGCIPTKLMIAGGEALAGVSAAAAFGVTATGVAFDYATLQTRKNGVVARLKDGVRSLLKANGVTVLAGTGAFLDRRRLAVSGPQGQRLLQADKVILATGSRSVMPRLFPASPRILESRAFLDLPDLPESLIVVGGGVIGCEFACLAARLGAAVTVVEMLPDILAGLDADVRRDVVRHMTRTLGIRIRTGVAIQDVADTGTAVTGTVGDAVVSADRMLVAVGRAPVTDGLDLEMAGLATTATGHIAVDDQAQTRVAGIYAIGDVTPGVQLAHRATSDGLVAANNAVCGRTDRTERLVPACLFTTPEVGTVGLTEHAAKAAGRNVRVGKFPFAALGKAMAGGHTDGFVKWIADTDTDLLLGAHVVGHGATDLIAEAAVAIRGEWTAGEFGRTIHAHPTLAEAWMEAAHAVHGQAIHAVNRKRA